MSPLSDSAGAPAGAGRAAQWRRLSARLRTAPVRITLAPQRVTAVRPAAGWATDAVAAVECMAAGGGAAAWREAVAALAQLLAAKPGWRGARAEVVLSNHFVRYAAVPWRADLIGATERLAFARHCFVRTYGEAAEAWELRLSETRYGAAAIATAVEPALLAALRAAIGAAALRPVSIEPLLADAFNRVRRRIDVERYWFAVAEPGRLCLAQLDGGAWRTLRCRRLDEDWRHGLARALVHEQLLDEDAGAECPLYLSAPELTGGELLRGSWTATGLRLPEQAEVLAGEPAAVAVAEGVA